jgi:hypothetical protein
VRNGSKLSMKFISFMTNDWCGSIVFHYDIHLTSNNHLLEVEKFWEELQALLFVIICSKLHCIIFLTGVDIRSSKICELGLLDYKAKDVFRHFERSKFRCRYDYYWASVFKVIISSWQFRYCLFLYKRKYITC